MTQPIGGYGRSYDYSRYDEQESSTNKTAREFCTTAKIALNAATNAAILLLVRP